MDHFGSSEGLGAFEDSRLWGHQPRDSPFFPNQGSVLATKCNSKWGPAARCSKANKEASLVERKVCFILDAWMLATRGPEGRAGQTPVQRPTPPY